MWCMFKRQIRAVPAGICVAVIVQESIWTGLDLVDPELSLNQALANAPLAEGWLAPLLLAWLVGGAFGGLMATLVGRNRFTGHAAGLLLSGSALLITALALPDAGGFLAIAGTPSVGAALGTWLGLAFVQDEPDRLTLPSIVTLRGGF